MWRTITQRRLMALVWLFLLGLFSSAAGAAGAPKSPALREPAVERQRELPTLRPDDFVDIAGAAPGIVVEARYAGYFNFIGRPIDGYKAPICLLTKRAAYALARVQETLKPFGFGLKVFDCYRPARAVAEFLRWSDDPRDTQMKSEFYPELDKKELFAKGYIAAKSSHSRGSTADLTLVILPAKIDVYMGTGFDFFSERSWPDDPQQPSEARANRLLLSSVMQLHGFKPYPYEWWHFTLADEPYPDTYFDFPVR
jgi:D-alanyl-D-alanine dipeptidase